MRLIVAYHGRECAATSLSEDNVMDSDYYAILNVGKYATAQEIHAAYLRLAHQHHPDSNRHDPLAGDRFKQIQLAYEALSSPANRAQYDRDPRAWGTHPVVHATERRTSPVEPVTVRPAPPKPPTRARYGALGHAAAIRLSKYAILGAAVVAACVACVAVSDLTWLSSQPRPAMALPQEHPILDTVKAGPGQNRATGTVDQATRPAAVSSVANHDLRTTRHPADLDQGSWPIDHLERDGIEAAAPDDTGKLGRTPEVRSEPADLLARPPSVGAERADWANPQAHAMSMSLETWDGSKAAMDEMDLELDQLINNLEIEELITESEFDGASPPWHPSSSRGAPAPVGLALPIQDSQPLTLTTSAIRYGTPPAAVPPPDYVNTGGGNTDWANAARPPLAPPSYGRSARPDMAPVRPAEPVPRTRARSIWTTMAATSAITSFATEPPQSPSPFSRPLSQRLRGGPSRIPSATGSRDGLSDDGQMEFRPRRPVGLFPSRTSSSGNGKRRTMFDRLTSDRLEDTDSQRPSGTRDRSEW